MKKRVIITILCAAIIFTGCGTKEDRETKRLKDKIEDLETKIANMESSSEDVEPATEYFDFTCDDLINELEEREMNFKLWYIFDDEENNEKMAAYNCTYDSFNTDNPNVTTEMKCNITYADKTKKVSHISFDIDSNEISALEHLFFYVFSMVYYLDREADTDDIADEIVKELTESEEDGFATASYEGNRYYLIVTLSDNYFNAFFMPNEE